jgi:hypothetical protein
VHIRKYREETKEGQRGANITIVAQQKMASRCNHKYRGATKDGQRGANINIVAQQKMAAR